MIKFLYVLLGVCILGNMNIINSSAVELEKNENIQKITLSFTGDCTLGDYNSNLINSFTKKFLEVKTPLYFFDKVKYIFKNDDFTFANLEGPLTNRGTKVIKQFAFRGKPEWVAILVEGCVDAVNLANNHTSDYGKQGLQDTMKYVTDNGIVYTYNKISFIKEIKGVKIGYIGYTGWANTKTLQNEIIRQVYEMRANNVKFIVANFHWGDELKYEPNATQVGIAHFAIDSGVDLVIGHHPHVMQGREIYRGKTIVYSLGNFCFGGNRKPYDDETVIYQHILSIDNAQKNIVQESSNIIPVKTSSSPVINNYQPIVPEGVDADVILKRFEDLSNRLIRK